MEEFPDFVAQDEQSSRFVQEPEAQHKGRITYLSPNATFRPELVPEKIYSCVAAFPIVSAGLTDPFFQSLKKEPANLHAALKENLAVKGPSLAVIRTRNCDPKCLGRDQRAWQPSTGTGWWSISRSGNDQFDYTGYTLFVSATVDGYTEDLREVGRRLQSRQLDMTVGQFLQTPEFQQAKKLAYRNLCRAADSIAHSLKIALVGRQADSEAPRVSPGLPQPTMAKPLAMTMYGGMTLANVIGTDGESREQVVISERCSTLLDNEGSPLIQLGALNGVAMVEGSPHALWSRSLDQAELERYAIPSGPAVASNAGLSERDRVYIENVCTWDPSRIASSKALSSSGHKASQMINSVMESHQGAVVKRYNHVISCQAS